MLRYLRRFWQPVAFARELGADEVVDYTQADWPKEVRRLTGRQGVDVVFEHTGAETWPGSISSLKRDGRLVTCGATSGYDAAIAAFDAPYAAMPVRGTWAALDATVTIGDAPAESAEGAS